MIQLDVREENLENADFVLRLINKIIITRIIEGEDQRLAKCFDFYDGVEPKVEFKQNEDYVCKVINETKRIVDTATQTFIGTLPDLVTTLKQVEKDKISVLNQKLYDADFDNAFFETCRYASKSGSGYIVAFNNIDDIFPRFRELNPKFAECVYDCSLERKHVMSYLIEQANDGNFSNVGLSKYIIYVYTKKRIYAFESPMTFTSQSTKPQAIKKIIVKPYFAWRLNGEEINFVEHGYGDIPLIEVPNNEEFRGDAECVFDLIKLYNELQNNRCKNVYDVVNYILMLKNVRLGDEEETKKVIDLLKRYRILPTEGDNVDAKFLTNPLDQAQLQKLADDIFNAIQRISRVPDLTSVDFSQNASDPILKIKTKPLLDLCKDKEKKCTKPYKRMLQIVLNWCKVHSPDFKEFDVDLSKIRLVYAHNLPSNDTDAVTILANMSNAKMANPEVLLQQFSFIPNVHEYIKGMNKWNEKVAKDKAISNNIIANPTNVERHNQDPLTKDKMDNKKNFNEGGAGTIQGINE